jgi:hypothetical protein
VLKALNLLALLFLMIKGAVAVVRAVQVAPHPVAQVL